jgi:hypothetical protein
MLKKDAVTPSIGDKLEFTRVIVMCHAQPEWLAVVTVYREAVVTVYREAVVTFKWLAVVT